MVKLLTALSFCVGNSFLVCVPALVLGSLSLLDDACQRRNLESWLGGYGLLVGEWVVTGCVVSPLFLGSLSLLRDGVSEQTLHGGRVDTGRWVLIGG